MAPSAKDRVFARLAQNGWTQDPRATRLKRRYSDEFESNPNIQLHSAAHGGQWRIQLVWTRSGSTWSSYEGDRLMSVDVFYLPEDQVFKTTEDGRYDRSSYKSMGHLRNVEHDHYRSSPLWDVLSWKNPDEGIRRSLREAAELLFANPDLAMWLAAEQESRKEREQAAVNEARRQERIERARLLPITVSQKSYTPSNPGPSEWEKLTYDLVYAVKAVATADGKSNLPKLVAEAQLALAAVSDALTDEASLEMGEYICTEVLSS